MKSTRLTCLAALLMAAVSGSPVLADQMPDSSGSGSYVKTISITAIKPYPVVKSDGKEYTHAEDDGNKKTFNARVTIRRHKPEETAPGTDIQSPNTTGGCCLLPAIQK